MFTAGMVWLITFIVCFYFSVPAYGMNYTDCSPENIHVLDVSVSNCEGEAWCPLYRGNFTDLSIVFQVDSEVNNLTALVHGGVGGVFLKFNHKAKNALHWGSGLICPLVPGKIYNYTTSINVKKMYPPIKSVVRWQLMEGQNKIVCVLIPGEII
ncbi:ML domain-containing protein [Caerostris darwini]|uniref:ML domain-containing protein n=1 Tax=Caerostris darwini TaxID=1538125 RepID=A0AAV4UWZ8_9ARAC|nr:ML domain-containing protein [Caerostris darwini]